MRLQLGFHAPGALLYRELLDIYGGSSIVVEADGFGGASTSVVQGDFPVDFLARYTKKFDSEKAATRAAEAVATRHTPPEGILA